MNRNKPIIISAHLIPNLLMHCLVALELDQKLLKNVNPSYREEFRSWCNEEEKNRFHKLKFSIEGVASNLYFAVLYQIPAYFSDDSIEDLIKTLNLLSSENFIDLLDHYPRKKVLVEKYTPLDMLKHVWGAKILDKEYYSNFLPIYAQMIKEIYNRDYFERWKGVQEKLIEKRKLF